ncbi:MAG: hypothetical protein ABSH30_06510 [Acidimicrobiales bacterium]
MAKILIRPSLALLLVGVLTNALAPSVFGGHAAHHAKAQTVHAVPHLPRYLGLLPTSPGFIPIAVWDQAPNGGNVPAQYKNQAQAFHAMGVNIFIGMNSWPERFGSDNGELAAAVASHMYVIGGGDPTSDTSATSVASIAALVAQTPGASKYFVGYQWGDEPTCSTDVAAQVAIVQREDPHRMVFENEGAWTAWLPKNTVGNATCLSQSEANLRATNVASSDEYALTDPWHTYLCRTRHGYDCLWAYGAEARNLRRLAGSTGPVWEFVETGGNDLGLSKENDGKAETQGASPAEVNSAAWEALLNGANGIEWFCDELLPNGTPIWDYCASNTIIRDNLTYVDHAIEQYAPELNAASVPNIASVQSSNSAVPINFDVKVVDGHTFLIVQGDRLGSTTGTYTLLHFAGGNARLLYDSNAQYDRTVSEQGKVFRLNSKGTFTDSLPASYSVKIYEISSGPPVWWAVR